MKRKISFVLCILIVIAFVFIYFTGGNITFDNIKEFNRLKSELPEGSEIKFSNGEFHIYVENLSDVSASLGFDIPADTLPDTVYAPEGGSFRANHNSDSSFSHVFMPRSISRLVIFKLQNNDIIDHIHDEYTAGRNISYIIKSVKSTLGIYLAGSLTDDTLKFVVETLYGSDIGYDEDMIIDSYLSTDSGNISILSMSSDTFSYNIYYPWNGNSVTAIASDAVWVDGVYDVTK